MFFSNSSLYRFSWALLITTQANLSHCTAYEIRTVHSLSELTPLIISAPASQGVLLLTDIDHTLMEPVSYEGSETWFQNLVKTRPEQFETALDFYFKSQEILAMRPVESILPRTWSHWQSHPHVAIIGLTSRSFCLASLTVKQLAQMGINFESKWIEESKMPGIAHSGILFATGVNKGEILSQFLESHPKFQEWQVIVVDDTWRHLEHVRNTFKNDYPHTPEPWLCYYPSSRQRYEDARIVPSHEEYPPTALLMSTGRPEKNPIKKSPSSREIRENIPQNSISSIAQNKR